MKKTTIVIETETVTAIRPKGPGSIPMHCPACGAEVPMITIEEAAAVHGISQRQVFRDVEADQIHFAETADGAILICMNSLGQRCEPQALNS
jgi:hypothetical protein